MTKGEIINAIYEANLTKRATLVVFYLINRADKDMMCFPGIKTIAKECNMSTRTVQRALNDLVEADFIKKENRFHPQGGQRSNIYYVQISEVEEINEDNESITFNSYEKGVNEEKAINNDEMINGKSIILKKNKFFNECDVINSGGKEINGFDGNLKLYFNEIKILNFDYCHGG